MVKDFESGWLNGERYALGPLLLHRLADRDLWIGEQWQKWHDERGYRRTASGHNDHVLTEDDHDSFDQMIGAA